MAGKPVYWDSCAFIAFLKAEQQHGQEELAALKQQANDFDNGIILLASSTITILEVLSSNLDEDKRQVFEGILDRSNFWAVDATDTVMRKAAEIRKYYHGKFKTKEKEPKSLIISSPDAIQLASAILINAEQFITLDSKHKPRQREVGLLRIPEIGKFLGKYSLEISKPSFGRSGSLFNER